MKTITFVLGLGFLYILARHWHIYMPVNNSTAIWIFGLVFAGVVLMDIVGTVVNGRVERLHR